LEPCDPDEAVALANRINEIMRTLPPDTQPATVMTALCAMLARAINTLPSEQREAALTWTTTLLREHAELDLPN
jgi:hypothetical protein